MFDGVLCGSDQIARGLLDGLREAGRKVPNDIGVLGFDNWTPWFRRRAHR
jgi:LacI family transcriptional regulator